MVRLFEFLVTLLKRQKFNTAKTLETIERMECLERLERLVRLERLERLESSDIMAWLKNIDMSSLFSNAT